MHIFFKTLLKLNRLIKLTMTFLLVLLFSGCGSHDPINRSLASDFVIDSTNAFKAYDIIKVKDNIIGFAINKQAKSLMIVGTEYYYTTGINSNLQTIINTPDIMNNIYLHYPTEKSLTTWHYKLVDYNGQPNNPPIMSYFTLYLCIKKELGENKILAVKKTIEDNKIKVIKLDDYCAILDLSGEAMVYEIKPEIKMIEIAKLPKAYPIILATVVKKSETKSKLQNGTAIILSPFATIADFTLTVGQYLALPVTIWFL